MDRRFMNIICDVTCITLFAMATGVLIGKLLMEFSVVSLVCLIVEVVVTTLYIIELCLDVSTLNRRYDDLVDDYDKYKERTEQAEDWIENLVFLHFDDDGNIKDIDELKKDIYWHAVHVGTKWNKK